MQLQLTPAGLDVTAPQDQNFLLRHWAVPLLFIAVHLRKLSTSWQGDSTQKESPHLATHDAHTTYLPIPIKVNDTAWLIWDNKIYPFHQVNTDSPYMALSSQDCDHQQWTPSSDVALMPATVAILLTNIFVLLAKGNKFRHLFPQAGSIPPLPMREEDWQPT